MFISSETQLRPSFDLLYTQAKNLLASGKKIIVEVAEHKKRRSSEANAYYWLFNQQLAGIIVTSAHAQQSLTLLIRGQGFGKALPAGDIAQQKQAILDDPEQKR